MADLLAKDGSQMETNPQNLPASKAETDRQIKTIITEIWNEQWQKRRDCRQTKIFFPKVDLKKSRQIISMSREHISRMMLSITGHDFRRKHEGLVNNMTDTQCRFCHEATESSSHIINECPRLSDKRFHYLDRPLGLSITPD